METFYAQLPLAIFIAIVGVGIGILWRTSIYMRGGIFRPIGRVLDYWVFQGCLHNAGWKHKVLRFIAYPLGRCIYCSTIHFTYDAFFALVYLFDLPLQLKWLVVILPMAHLFTIMYMKWFVNGNPDMAKSDWRYMQKYRPIFIDRPKKIKLDAETLKLMDACKEEMDALKG